VAFRLPAVWVNDANQLAGRTEWLAKAHAAMDELVALPEAERSTRLAEARQKSLAHRAGRNLEYPAALSKNRNIWDAGDWLSTIYTNDRFNFWSYINELDSAQAFDKALFANYEGSHALFVNANNNYLNYDTNTLLNLFFPDVTERKQAITGAVSPVNNDKARALIGYEPEHAV
jgi:hypothetical protein